MYSYYFLTELGMNSKYGGVIITPIQLIQFVLAISSTIYEGLYRFPSLALALCLSSICLLSNMGHCRSHPYSLYWMWFTYSVFLAFFLKLFMDKKQQRSAAKSGDKAKKTQ